MRQSKIKILIALSITVLLSSFLPYTASASLGPNLIANPSVEDSSGRSFFQFFSTPTSWSKNHSSWSISSFYYPVSGHNSSRAVKVQSYYYYNFTSSKISNAGEGWYFDYVKIDPTKKYLFSDYYISDTTSYISASFKLSNGSTAKIDIATVPSSSSWKQAEAEITPPAGAVSVTILHYINSKGSLTTDDYYFGENISSPADTTPPVITLLGSSKISLTVGDSYNDAGAVATDNVDGDITSKIVTVNPVNTSRVGTYIVTYNVKDAAGNAAAQITREVDVADIIPPLDNLILNPNLESGTTTPDYWNQGNWGTNSASFAYPVTGYSGKGASVTINSYTDGDAKWYFDNVAVVPGKYYVFSDEYKSTVGTHVVVEFHSTSNTFSYQEIGTPSASSSWQKFQAGFNVPLGVNSLTIYHLLNSVGVLTVDNFSLVQGANPGSYSKGMVSLTFDDGWQSNYDTAIPILNAAGFKSTQYIISNYIGDTADGYMTLNELKTIYQQGHDIAAHTRNHLNLTDPTTDLQDEIAGSRTDLLANFSPVNSIAYPFGRYNATVESIAQNAGFSAGRTVDRGFNDKSTNPYALTVQIVERGGVCEGDNAPTTTLDQVKNWIDTAAATNTWLILVFHQTDNNSSNCYGDTPTMLQNIVNYLKTSNVNVVTVSQGLKAQ